MKKHLLTCATVCAIGISAYASPLTPAEALARLNTTAPAMRPAAGDVCLRLTQKHDGADALYLFSRGADKGFLLLPADDSSAPLLGYSDSGSFPESDADISPDFRYWMEFLAAQVAANADAGAAYVPARVVGSAIDPLVLTRWNQDAPYFNDCPVAGTRHCYTGCVATAMSQVLYYHQYPAVGTGSHTYTWKNPVTEKDTTISFDYASTTFDWDAMSHIYDKESTEVSREAVAKLMLAAGVAVDMDYGLSGSGAAAILIPKAMVDYFGYDKGCRQYYRDYYGVDEWNQLVYDQLSSCGPLQYSGQSNDGGHSFVCDGYDGNGYFHINWGWGGMSDGYFLLTVLDPGTQGIGGSTSGYNFSQSVVGNVSTEQTSTDIYPVFYAEGPLTLDKDSVDLGDRVLVHTGGTFNYSAGTVSKVTFGLKLTSADGKVRYLVGGTASNLGIGYGISSFNVTIPDGLEDGTYTATLAMRNTQNEWEDVRMPVGVRDEYELSVADGIVALSEGETAEITISGLTNDTPFFIGENFEISADIENATDVEYLEEVRVTLTPVDDDSTVIAVGENISLDIPAGSTQKLDYLSTFEATTGNTLGAGTYNLYISRRDVNSYVHLAGPLTIELQDAVTTEVKVTEFSITRTQYKDAIKASAKVECTSGYYCGVISLAIADIETGRVLHWIYSDTVVLLAGGSGSSDTSYVTRADENTDFPSTVTVEFDGTFPDGVAGKEYEAAVFKDGTMLTDARAIDLKDAVETLELQTVAPEKIEYLTLDGLSLGTAVSDGTPSLDTTRPDSGLILMRVTYPDGTVRTRKLLLR